MVKNIAVVGSGIGGVSAAYHLAKDGHAVTLYEKNKEIGGHSYTIKVNGEPVDLGFMMYGDSNPNIKAWFKNLGLTNEKGTTSKRIPMSLSVSSDVDGDLQFSSRRPFTKLSDATNWTLWQLLLDIYRFTMDLLEMPVKSDKLTKDWMKEGRYSREFYRHYFLPFVAILWTVPKSDVLNLPASQFLRCLKTHAHSLYVPVWEVVMGALGKRVSGPKHQWWFMGAKYRFPFLEWFQKQDGCSVRCSTPVVEVGKGGKFVRLESGEVVEHDHVVLACHAEQSAKMIHWSKWAKELQKYYFHQSMIYVHTDTKFLPMARKQWASWNVHITKDDQYILTYWMNRIQRLEQKSDVFVSIVPKEENRIEFVPREGTIIQQFPWDHPRLLADCIPENKIIQEPGISLGGAWLGRGFHEDGFVAGRRVARIVNDPACAAENLYEDPENIPIPPVTPHKLPRSISAGLTLGAVLCVVAAIGPFLYSYY